MIDGQLQQAGGHGRFIRFSDAPEAPFSIQDLSEVYTNQAESVQRGITLLPTGEVLIQDELGGLPPGSQVRWGMITSAEAGPPESATMVLKQHGEQLTLSLLAPEGASWQIVDTATPRAEWDSANPNTRMVAFEVSAPDSGELRLGVLITPTSRTTPTRNAGNLTPLAQWP